MKISHSKCSSSARKRRKERRRMHRAKVSKHRDSRGTGTKRSTKSVINKGPSKSHTLVGHIKKKNSHIAKSSLTPLNSGNKKGSTTSNIKSSKTSSTCNSTPGSREMTNLMDCWNQSSSTKASRKLRSGSKFGSVGPLPSASNKDSSQRPTPSKQGNETDQLKSCKTNARKRTPRKCVKRLSDQFEKGATESFQPETLVTGSDVQENPQLNRKKLRSEVADDELWEGFPNYLKIKRFKQKSNTDNEVGAEIAQIPGNLTKICPDTIGNSRGANDANQQPTTSLACQSKNDQTKVLLGTIGTTPLSRNSESSTNSEQRKCGASSTTSKRSKQKGGNRSTPTKCASPKRSERLRSRQQKCHTHLDDNFVYTHLNRSAPTSQNANLKTISISSRSESEDCDSSQTICKESTAESPLSPKYSTSQLPYVQEKDATPDFQDRHSFSAQLVNPELESEVMWQSLIGKLALSDRESTSNPVEDRVNAKTSFATADKSPNSTTIVKLNVIDHNEAKYVDDCKTRKCGEEKDIIFEPNVSLSSETDASTENVPPSSNVVSSITKSQSDNKVPVSTETDTQGDQHLLPNTPLHTGADVSTMDTLSTSGEVNHDIGSTIIKEQRTSMVEVNLIKKTGDISDLQMLNENNQQPHTSEIFDQLLIPKLAKSEVKKSQNDGISLCENLLSSEMDHVKSVSFWPSDHGYTILPPQEKELIKKESYNSSPEYPAPSYQASASIPITDDTSILDKPSENIFESLQDVENGINDMKTRPKSYEQNQSTSTKNDAPTFDSTPERDSNTKITFCEGTSKEKVSKEPMTNCAPSANTENNKEKDKETHTAKRKSSWTPNDGQMPSTSTAIDIIPPDKIKVEIVEAMDDGPKKVKEKSHERFQKSIKHKLKKGKKTKNRLLIKMKLKRKGSGSARVYEVESQKTCNAKKKNDAKASNNKATESHQRRMTDTAANSGHAEKASQKTADSLTTNRDGKERERALISSPVERISVNTRRGSISPAEILGLKPRKRKSIADEASQNSRLGQYACTLWSSEQRRHFQQSYPDACQEELDARLRRTWERMTDVEKTKYYQRAKRALGDENKSIKTTKKDGECAVNKSKGNRSRKGQTTKKRPWYERCKSPLDAFYHLPVQEQYAIIKEKLEKFQKYLSDEEYRHFIRDFKLSFKNTKEKVRPGQVDIKESWKEYMDSVSRRLLYTKIQQMEGKVNKRAKQRQQLVDKELRASFEDLVEKLIDGQQQLVEDPEEYSPQVTHVLSCLKEVESRKPQWYPQPIKSKSFENTLEEVCNFAEGDYEMLVVDSERVAVPKIQNQLLEKVILCNSTFESEIPCLYSGEVEEFFNETILAESAQFDYQPYPLIDDPKEYLLREAEAALYRFQSHLQPCCGMDSPSCVLTAITASKGIGE